MKAYTPNLVSVLLPVFNAARYVERAVESVLSQTHDRLELIIIDDGSVDGSSEILERLAGKDARVRLVRRPNTGYAVALNEALAMARGGVLARMDADDVSSPDRFEKQSQYLTSHPECVAVGCGVRQIDSDGEPLIEPEVVTGHERILEFLLRGYGAVIPHPGLMARTPVVRSLGGYRVGFEPVEDLDLYLRLADVGRLENLPDILIEYRQHVGSVSHLRHEEQLRKARAVVVEAYGRRGEPVGDEFQLPGWKPPADLERFKSWFWTALQSGRTPAARRYALHILKTAPFSIDSWRIAYCAARGN